MQRLPLVRERAADPERVQPQGLHLDGLADPGRDDPVSHLRVHPGQLDAGLPRGEQAVGVGLDPISRPARVARQDRLDRALEARHGRPRRRPAGRGHGLEVIVDRDDVPERRVDRVVLGLGALVGKKIWQHALGDGAGPFREDPLGLGQAAGRETQAAERDERVAAPVGEPRVPRDDGPTRAAAHEIRVGRAIEPIDERGPPRSLGRPQRLESGSGAAGTERAFVSLGGREPNALPSREIEAIFARRREVFGKVEAPRLFLGVEEMAVPLGRGGIRAV